MMRDSLRTTTLVAILFVVGLFVVGLFAGGTTFAQFEPNGGFEDDKPKLTVHSARFSPKSAGPDETVMLEIEVSVLDGWHVYGTRSEMKDMIPAFDDLAGLQADGRIVTPKGDLHDDGNEWLEGKFKLQQRYRVPAKAEPGELRLRGRLSYIPCTPTYCLSPTKAGFTAEFTVTGNNPRRAPEEREIAHVRQAFVVEDSVKAGQKVTLKTFVELNPGWHVYGAKHEKPFEDFPDQRITLRLDEGPVFKPIGDNVVPDGKKKVYDGIDMTTWELIGRFPITLRVQVAKNAKAGPQKLAGTITYSPCDESACYNEQTVSFATVVNIAAGTTPDIKTENTDETTGVPSNGGSPQASEKPPENTSTPKNQEGLWQFIVLAIGGGLLALMMPCTYPMIPITISFFTKQASDRNGSVLPLALTYGLGIIVVFVLIGVTVGQPIIKLAQNEWLNAIIGVIFIVFALSLFGAFTLNPPRFLMNMAGKASGQGGYLGVFLMGTALVVTSFTCTGPFVGALLAVGAGSLGDSLGVVALGMGVFGATMALPFVFLSLLPGRLQKMPRSGEWMNTVKVYLGFIEFAAAIKFFQNAEIKVQAEFMTRELFLLLWAGTFGAAAAYLFGWIRLKSDGDGIGPWRMTIGLCTLLFATYCVYGAMGNRMDTIMTAIVPPAKYGKLHATNDGGQETPSELTYTIISDDYQKALALAKEQGRKVVVNFTGHT